MKELQITQSITNRETQSIETYFNEISRVDLITANEEVMLAQKIKQGDKAALDRLVRANLRFVVSIAKKYQYQGLPLSDLINEGNLGLIKAAQRFDETRGFKFISFAVWWIRQSIMASITEHARMIRLPLNKVNEITRINRAHSVVEQQWQREPTPEAVAEYLDSSPERVSEALEHAVWTVSADAPVAEDGFNLYETIGSDWESPDTVLMRESERFEIEDLLKSLSEREKKIIKLYFGIGYEREMSPMEICKEVGLTTERARQIRNEALNKLRFATNNVILS